MNILVLNAGSSSLKFQLFDMNGEMPTVKGIGEKIGSDDPKFKYETDDIKYEVDTVDMKDHVDAVKMIIQILTDPELNILTSLNDIHAVGHRIAHGGEECTSSFVIDERTIQIIEKNKALAPLHNGANIAGIKAVQSVMGDVFMVGVPDTAFHHTIPEHAYIYPLPYSCYEDLRIRKYGFHGSSHSYVSKKAADMLGKPYESMKIVSCHLGNGSSVCAVKNGESVETTMGFTPLEGLAMGTRCGSIDPAILLHLMDKEGMDADKVSNLINKESGLLGISGVSNDFRDIHNAAEAGNKRASLAEMVFAYKVKKCIGEYAAVMGGIDALVFTAGIGENDDIIRQLATEDMAFLGIEIDRELNKGRGDLGDISTDDAKVRTMVICTDEELVIARETKACYEKA